MKRILVFQTVLTLIFSNSLSFAGFLTDEDFQFTFPHTTPLMGSKGENYSLLHSKPRLLNMSCNKANFSLLDEWEMLGVKPREGTFKIWKIKIFNPINEKIGKVVLREFDTENKTPQHLFELNVLFIEKEHRRKNIGSRL
ncbi:MAG: hypothetical protein BGO67_02650 [Alphaproteobacteria bacterium 41-28]|nr:MAG: hypothetical protein BGO67_02650 [Alphaproteobacteria bacterium 41-28]